MSSTSFKRSEVTVAVTDDKEMLLVERMIGDINYEYSVRINEPCRKILSKLMILICMMNSLKLWLSSIHTTRLILRSWLIAQATNLWSLSLELIGAHLVVLWLPS